MLHSLILAGLILAGVPPAAAAELPEPSPELAPEEVIGTVLAALARPDQPERNAGIERTFRFASPDNRAQTGPLDRFIDLVRNPMYAPLLGHERAIRGDLQRRGDGEVYERVRVIASDGSTAAFVFVLSRQAEGDCAGCWMTDAVIRVEPEGMEVATFGGTPMLFEVASQMASRLRRTSVKVRDLAFLDVTGRVARTLLELAHEPDAMTHPDGMQVKITRQEIARIVGCSREMVGRVLKDLEDQGLIHAHGKTMVVFGTR